MNNFFYFERSIKSVEEMSLKGITDGITHRKADYALFLWFEQKI